MRKIFKKKTSFLLLASAFLIGAVFSLNFALKTKAASETVGDLTLEYPGVAPLFYSLNIVPGYEEVKTITVTNNGTVSRIFSMALSSRGGKLGDVLLFEPRNFETKVPYWTYTINKIAASENGFPILTIPPKVTVKIDLAAILPGSIDNEYQGLTISTFDIIFGGDWSGQTYTDNPPAVLPIEPVNEQTGGGPGRRVRGLVGTSAISRLTTPGAGDAIEAPIVVQPKTQTTEVVDEGVKGAATKALPLCFWWLVISILYIVFLILYHIFYVRRDKDEDKNDAPAYWWAWPIPVGVILFFVQAYFDQFYRPTIFCRYFWALELLILIIYYILEIRSISAREEK